MIRLQIGRAPRGAVTVATRCSRQMPQVIRTEAALGDGSPFPTLFWLTCPARRRDVARLEDSGMIGEIQARVDCEPSLAGVLRDAAHDYVLARDGDAPPGSTMRGIGGAAQPLAVKCLHSHYAHYLATGGNPIGAIVEEALGPLDPDSERLCEGCGR